ncbi:single-stranded DNA-binding protein [Spiroplasma sp. ChiS]|nr:single-stranded DNA-binding protein [Spiroplasma sp. ChiS]PQP78454.1 single-stranded DNA-binding protein [Spiroplasma sp. ChiS]
MINEIRLMGHLTHDLKKEYVKINNEETTVVNFQIAVNSHKDKDKNKTLFVNCVVFRQQADNLFTYLVKGDRLYVAGSLSIQKYNDQNGKEKNSTKVIVSKLVFLNNNKEKDQ